MESLLLNKKVICLTRTFLCFLTTAFIAVAVYGQRFSNKMHGPLRISDVNPRYFTDDLGKAIYLTGSHTWNNLVDMSPDDPPQSFDYRGYIEWLIEHNHNFVRLWAWELLNWNTSGNNEENTKNHNVTPHPWTRTGPSNARDGKPKFDLTEPDPEYFRRLRKRVKLAARNGIYVSVMLFEGWGLQFSPEAFQYHPFHPDNNINGINGDSNGDGMGLEIHTLDNEGITAIQKDYITEVIRAVNKYDNVLYEISNENHPPSTDWQYAMISFIKQQEAGMKKQHPVGMTFQYRGGKNQTLFESPADWISPNADDGYRDNPPSFTGSKVVITDTDHLWGIGGNNKWVWKSFLRGLNPIFMDPYNCEVLRGSFAPEWVEPLRTSMGLTLSLTMRVDLIHMVPEPDVASSGYCLANKGKEYLIYVPDEAEVTVDLKGVIGSFQVEWFNPDNGELHKSEPIKGGKRVSLPSPFGASHAVLYLNRE